MNNLILKIKAFLGQFSEFEQWHNISLSQRKMKVVVYSNGTCIVRSPLNEEKTFNSFEEAEDWIKKWRNRILVAPLVDFGKEIYI